MIAFGREQDRETWKGDFIQSSGEDTIPGALTTVNIDMEKDQGVYVESNVWMFHELKRNK